MIKHDVFGNGPSVLLLHSGGMSSRQWRRFGERLSSSYRVILPDFLGSGDNPPWPQTAPFTFHADVQEIIALLEQYGPLAHIVGHSYGGLIALTVARLRSQAIKSVAAYDPVAFGVLHGAADREGLTDLARASDNPVFVDDARGGDNAWFEAFVDYWNGAGYWSQLPEPARASFLRVGRKVYLEVRSLMADRTPASAYSSIKQPSLLFTGERSPAAARRVVQLLAGVLPTSRIVTVPGAGHMGPITHSNAVQDEIERHLASAEHALTDSRV